MVVYISVINYFWIVKLHETFQIWRFGHKLIECLLEVEAKQSPFQFSVWWAARLIGRMDGKVDYFIFSGIIGVKSIAVTSVSALIRFLAHVENCGSRRSDLQCSWRASFRTVNWSVRVEFWLEVSSDWSNRIFYSWVVDFLIRFDIDRSWEYRRVLVAVWRESFPFLSSKRTDMVAASGYGNNPAGDSAPFTAAPVLIEENWVCCYEVPKMAASTIGKNSQWPPWEVDLKHAWVAASSFGVASFFLWFKPVVMEEGGAWYVNLR